MSADPSRARDLFLAAADLPADGRPAFLAAACGPDSELRSEVDRLLAAHADPDSLLDPPAAPTPPGGDGKSPTAEFRAEPDTVTVLPAARAAAVPGGPAPGAVIAGRYVLVERLGEGGMGEVWVARQTDPVTRAVALKLVKAGMDSRAVLARFEVERQALALMDHPNIAGSSTAGRRPPAARSS